MTTRRFIVEPRGLASPQLKLFVPVASVLAAMAVGAVFLLVTGVNPLTVYAQMYDAAFGSARGFSETLISATPLILTGVAAAIAFKMLVWNIGGEGQFLMGAVFAAGIAIWLGDGAPAALALPAVVLAGGLGGAVWAAVAAVPRVYLGTNEIITTLMLNFIALNFVNFLIFGSNSPWRDPAVTTFPSGRPIPDAARMPDFFNRLDIGIFIAIGMAVAAWYLMEKTSWGFAVRIVGDSSSTARYAGVGVAQKILGVFLLSGAAAGFAGGLFVSGPVGALDPRSLDLGLGFTGIIVAALARLNLIAVIPVAILMGALNNSGPSLQAIGVPTATVTMLQGAILIFAVAGEFFIRNRLRRPERSSSSNPEEVVAA
ncbi:MAG: ABC transporter permease [Actinomycetota bacterium]|nr:ABC transporter permease [Actinomycetota bacterium]MDK1016475.1 ABC transporter permease [Actinomycetota bacterium]MDK1026211.1 ABC transporter permease [Actinomycetota bacterium]MDK1037699.1 ABC transporter permease [Actinomycetota bacterium]MDK1096018.1 ABC transporter permease [Actinomycetota bacterium]